MTSPPYFGLRDYGHDGQIGLEETPEAYVANLVEVFSEVRRTLRDDGTLWLNLGDSYARPPGKGGSGPGGKSREWYGENYGQARGAEIPEGLKPKDQIGIPWRVAFALQADGWYLRQDIIWHKPNPMPESVRDRCTKAHEYVFLLSKEPRYYFDAEAIKEPAVKGAAGSTFNAGKTAAHLLGRSSDKARVEDGTRNRRSVWTIPTNAGAHFATYPPDLIEPCIRAGSPPGGIVLDPFWRCWYHRIGGGQAGAASDIDRADPMPTWRGCALRPSGWGQHLRLVSASWRMAVSSHRPATLSISWGEGGRRWWRPALRVRFGDLHRRIPVLFPRIPQMRVGSRGG